MARKEQLVRIGDWGLRDAGKLYRIKEMDSVRAEKWAIRAMLLVKGSSARVPESIVGRGMEAIAIITINVVLQADIEFEKLEPLLDEMMECVEIVRDPKAPHVVTPIVSPDDIAEVSVRAFLRSEVLKLHTGFSPADALSKLISAIMKPEDSEST